MDKLCFNRPSVNVCATESVCPVIKACLNLHPTPHQCTRACVSMSVSVGVLWKFLSILCKCVNAELCFFGAGLFCLCKDVCVISLSFLGERYHSGVFSASARNEGGRFPPPTALFVLVCLVLLLDGNCLTLKCYKAPLILNLILDVTDDSTEKQRGFPLFGVRETLSGFSFYCSLGHSSKQLCV